MKIGKEAESIKIQPKHFESLAEDTGLAKPMVLKRVPELAEQILINLNKVDINSLITQNLRKIIEERCRIFLNRFRKI